MEIITFTDEFLEQQNIKLQELKKEQQQNEFECLFWETILSCLKDLDDGLKREKYLRTHSFYS